MIFELTPFSTKKNANSYMSRNGIDGEVVDSKNEEAKGFYAVLKKPGGLRIIGENGKSLFFKKGNNAYIGLIGKD